MNPGVGRRAGREDDPRGLPPVAPGTVPEPPSPVRLATRLWTVVAVLSIVLGLIRIVCAGDFATDLFASMHDRLEGVTETDIRGRTIIGGNLGVLAGIGYLIGSRYAGRGRAVARMALTFVALIDAVVVGLGVLVPTPGFIHLAFIVQALVALTATALMWLPVSSEYFRRSAPG